MHAVLLIVGAVGMSMIFAAALYENRRALPAAGLMFCALVLFGLFW